MRNRRFAARAGLVTFAVLVAGTAVALQFYLGTMRVVYDGASLSAGATKVDTVVVSSEARNEPRAAQLVWAFACSSSAASADSMQYAVVRAISGGRRLHVGQDSLVLRPDGSAVNWTGETQIMHTVADSYEVRTVNPTSTAGKGALHWYSRSER